MLHQRKKIFLLIRYYLHIYIIQEILLNLKFKLEDKIYSHFLIYN